MLKSRRLAAAAYEMAKYHHGMKQNSSVIMAEM